MIEKVAPTVPVSTWSKSNSTEVITVDKKLGELNRLSKVFRREPRPSNRDDALSRYSS